MFPMQVYAMPVYDMIEYQLVKRHVPNGFVTRLVYRTLYIVLVAFVAITLPFFGGMTLLTATSAFACRDFKVLSAFMPTNVCRNLPNLHIPVAPSSRSHGFHNRSNMQTRTQNVVNMDHDLLHSTEHSCNRLQDHVVESCSSSTLSSVSLLYDGGHDWAFA